MPRNIQTTVANILAGNSLLGVLLIELNYDGGSFYFTDCPFDLTWTSPTAGVQTYEAQGNFLGITETQETAELQVSNIDIVLSALDIDLVRAIAKPTLLNKEVAIYKAFLDPLNEFNIIGEESAGSGPINIYEGRISGYRLSDRDDDASLVIEIASQFVNFTQQNGRKTTEASIQKDFPNERFFEYAHESINDILWGKI
jgi:hypothetical protein